MRIAMLSDASVVHTWRWAEALMERGHTLELWSLEPGAGFDYPFHRLDPPWGPRFWRYPAATPRLRRQLQAFQPDVVNAHFVPNYGLLGVLAGYRPLVVSVWGSDVLISPKATPLHRWRARYVLERADWITTDAAMLTRAVVALGGRGECITTVPMGVDVERYRTARTPAPAGPLVISTRKLEPLYNVGLLVEAMPKIMESLGNARFLVAGDGPERARLEERTRRLGAPVEFLGMIPNAQMARVLGASHIYVSTSTSDSTSVSLLEAMAAGLVPVVTDIEANREWVTDGENGFLVPIDRPDVLARAVVRAWQDEAWRQSVVLANGTMVRQRANWADNMDEVETVLRVLAGRGERSRGGAGG